MDKQKLQEARKAVKGPQRVSRAENDVQAVLDLPDSPKVVDRKEVEEIEKANQQETKKMIEEIKLRQERDK